ncbi:seipin-1 [Lactuca sativa]|uniref:seipin-1 n=1 Tax=Lactuca sativa TaxID=4236 RepID=UPI000CBF1C54|nr:seipin-1 [Lactuca sativa]
MEPPEQHRHHHHTNFWFIKLLSLQSDFLSDCLLSLLSPFLSIFSLASTFRRIDSTKEPIDAPSSPVQGSIILLKKALLGFLGAAYVCWVLITVMVVSVVVGVALVNLWVEEPVYIKENLYFDYTDVHPYAILDLGFDAPGKTVKNIPVGHFCNVRLTFVMPESDYNREIGNFQVAAEALTMTGEVITTASRPCMLRFRSRPLRLMQTFLMGVPLLLGITHEVQTVNLQLLRYKEHYYPRTRSMRLSLIPRAGTPFLPQLYEAKVIVTSELPWKKELVRKWKWTFYVWTSLYVYLMLLVVLVCGFRSIMFPAMAMTVVSGEERLAVSDVPAEEMVGGKDGPTSETLRRWRQSRSKRKAMLLGESDATSMSVTRDEDTSVTTEEVGDSESVCH